MSKSSKRERYATLPQREISQASGNVIWVLLVAMAYSAIQVIREGTGHNHYLALLIGSVASIVALFIYVLEDIVSSSATKSVWASFWWAIPDFIGLVSMTLIYAFGCYLVFYQGFWGLKAIGSGSPVTVVLNSIFAIAVGYGILFYETKVYDLLKSYSKSQKQSGNKR